MVKSQNGTGAASASGGTVTAAPQGSAILAQPMGASEPPIAPTLPANPAEKDKAIWRSSSASDAEYFREGDRRPKRICAMALIDWHQNGAEKSNDYFDNVLKAQGLGIAGDKPMMRAATVATGLNRADPQTGEKDGKQLDVLASAMAGLLKLASAAETKFAYCPDCVQELVDLIDEEGGYTKTASLGRKKDVEDDPCGVFDLDGGKAQEACLAVARDRLAPAPGDFIEPVGLPGVAVERSAFEQALAKTDLFQGAAYRLWLLTQATAIVVRQETALLVKRDADPKGKVENGKKVMPAKRFTEPHIISRTDGSFLVSGHMAAAGNVLHIRGLGEVLEQHPGHDIVMPPQAHHKLAKNLEAPLRRNVVEVSEGEPNPGTTQTVATYRLRSSFAKEAAYQPEGPGLSISWYAPTYGSTSDNFVKDVRADRVWNEVGQLSLDLMGFIGSIAHYEDRFKNAASKKQSRRLTIEGGEFSVAAADIGKPLSCSIKRVDKAKHSMFVMGADLRNLLVFLKDMRFAPGSELTLSLDSKFQALKWSFMAAGVSYELFMPTANERGVWFTDAFENLRLVAPLLAKAA